MKRRYEFIWTVRNAYEDIGQKRNLNGVLYFAGLTTIVFWFFFALEPALTVTDEWFARWLFGWLPSGAFLVALRQAVLPGLLLAGVYLWLYFKYRGKPERKMRTRGGDAPDPHEGLIFLLSRYGGPPRGMTRKEAEDRGIPPDAEALRAVLEDQEPGSRENLRQTIFATNWGPLWAAVQHHRNRLTHCWLVSTEGEGGSREQADVAALLVQAAALRSPPVECYYDECWVTDAYAIETVVPVIDGIYTEALPMLNIEEDQVIADLTGGTAAMSAGMAMATVDRARKIEYLRQDKHLLVKDEGARPRSPEEIREEPILVVLETWRKLVPQHTDRHTGKSSEQL